MVSRKRACVKLALAPITSSESMNTRLLLLKRDMQTSTPLSQSAHRNPTAQNQYVDSTYPGVTLPVMPVRYLLPFSFYEYEPYHWVPFLSGTKWYIILRE